MLGVNEDFESKRNDKVALLDNFGKQKKHLGNPKCLGSETQD